MLQQHCRLNLTNVTLHILNTIKIVFIDHVSMKTTCFFLLSNVLIQEMGMSYVNQRANEKKEENYTNKISSFIIYFSFLY